VYYYLLSRGLQRKRKSSPSKLLLCNVCARCLLQPIRRGVVMSFLLRALVPPDLLLLG